MKFKAKKRLLEAEDELGVDWERVADGRPWRLKRKKHFGDVDPGMAMEAATNAARRMGKAVQTTRDRQSPKKYCWVQFADGRIRLGDPCSCGSRRFYRLHPHFLRCVECNRMLIQSDSPNDEYESRAAFKLRKLSGVCLSRIDPTEEHEIYRGYGEWEGQPMLVRAEFEPEDGKSVTAEDAYQRIAKVEWLPFDGLSDIFDISALRGDAPDWDLVLSGSDVDEDIEESLHEAL